MRSSHGSTCPGQRRTLREPIHSVSPTSYAIYYAFLRTSCQLVTGHRSPPVITPRVPRCLLREPFWKPTKPRPDSWSLLRVGQRKPDGTPHKGRGDGGGMKRKKGTKVDEKQQQKSRQEAWGKHLAAPMPPNALLPCPCPYPSMPMPYSHAPRFSPIPSFFPILAFFCFFLLCLSFLFSSVLSFSSSLLTHHYFLSCLPPTSSFTPSSFPCLYHPSLPFSSASLPFSPTFLLSSLYFPFPLLPSPLFPPLCFPPSLFPCSCLRPLALFSLFFCFLHIYFLKHPASPHLSYSRSHPLILLVTHGAFTLILFNKYNKNIPSF